MCGGKVRGLGETPHAGNLTVTWCVYGRYLGTALEGRLMRAASAGAADGASGGAVNATASALRGREEETSTGADTDAEAIPVWIME